MNKSIDRSLKLSLVDAFLHSLMIGLGETYLPAYVLSIGMGEIYAGLLSSLPLLSGAVLQLFAPKFIKIFKSTKYWIVFTTSLQAFAYIPLIYFTLHKAPDFWTLFIILTLYWGAAFASGPAWNYWMGELVPAETSALFFSRRSKVMQFGILIGLVLGGVALHNKVVLGSMTSVFTGLFGFAFLFRLFSSWTLSKKSFLPHWNPEVHLSFKDAWNLFWKNTAHNRFFIYLFFYQMMVFISSPYVNPYMLAQIKMNYGQYMGAIAGLFIGKLLMLTFLESRNKKINEFDLLKFALLTVSPLPLAWALSSDYVFILILQLASGMAWSCLEVGLALLFFADLKRNEKIPFITFYNLLSSLAILIGTGVGGLVLKLYGENLQTYYHMFILGGLLRILAAIPLSRVILRLSRHTKTKI